MTQRDILIYLIGGLSVWLNGAVSFRLGGRLLFDNGPWVAALAAIAIAAAVCLVLRAAMAWRKAPASQAVTIAVIMALPGLFCEAAQQLLFHWATGLTSTEQPTFAAAIFFGNAALLTYALIKARPA